MDLAAGRAKGYQATTMARHSQPTTTRRLATLQSDSYTLDMRGYVPRLMEQQLQTDIQKHPVVALLGPRQCGKTTLVQELGARLGGALYVMVRELWQFFALFFPKMPSKTTH